MDWDTVSSPSYNWLWKEYRPRYTERLDGVNKIRAMVCFMFLKPDGEVTTLRKSLLSWRVLVGYLEHSRES